MALPDPAWRVRTRPCPFYQKGCCIFGANCNFLHSLSVKTSIVEDTVSETRSLKSRESWNYGTPGRPPVVTVESPRSVRSPTREPQMARLLSALTDVIGDEPVEEQADESFANSDTLVEPPSAWADGLPTLTHGADSTFFAQITETMAEMMRATEDPSPQFSDRPYSFSDSFFDGSSRSSSQLSDNASDSGSSQASPQLAGTSPDDDTLRLLPSLLPYDSYDTPSIHTTHSSPDQIQVLEMPAIPDNHNDLLSPVDLSQSLHNFSLDDPSWKDTSSIDSGFVDSCKPPVERSPPRSPARSSTFELLHSPFGSPSARVLSPRLSAFIGRSPSSPLKPLPYEQEPAPLELDLDSPRDFLPNIPDDSEEGDLERTARAPHQPLSEEYSAHGESYVVTGEPDDDDEDGSTDSEDEEEQCQSYGHASVLDPEVGPATAYVENNSSPPQQVQAEIPAETNRHSVQSSSHGEEPNLSYGDNSAWDSTAGPSFIYFGDRSPILPQVPVIIQSDNTLENMQSFTGSEEEEEEDQLYAPPDSEADPTTTELKRDSISQSHADGGDEEEDQSESYGHWDLEDDPFAPDSGRHSTEIERHSTQSPAGSEDEEEQNELYNDTSVWDPEASSTAVCNEDHNPFLQEDLAASIQADDRRQSTQSLTESEDGEEQSESYGRWDGLDLTPSEIKRESIQSMADGEDEEADQSELDDDWASEADPTAPESNPQSSQSSADSEDEEEQNRSYDHTPGWDSERGPAALGIKDHGPQPLASREDEEEQSDSGLYDHSGVWDPEAGPTAPHVGDCNPLLRQVEAPVQPDDESERARSPMGSEAGEDQGELHVHWEEEMGPTAVETEHQSTRCPTGSEVEEEEENDLYGHPTVLNLEGGSEVEEEQTELEEQNELYGDPSAWDPEVGSTAVFVGDRSSAFQDVQAETQRQSTQSPMASEVEEEQEENELFSHPAVRDPEPGSTDVDVDDQSAVSPQVQATSQADNERQSTQSPVGSEDEEEQNGSYGHTSVWDSEAGPTAVYVGDNNSFSPQIQAEVQAEIGRQSAQSFVVPSPTDANLVWEEDDIESPLTMNPEDDSLVYDHVQEADEGNCGEDIAEEDEPVEDRPSPNVENDSTDLGYLQELEDGDTLRSLYDVYSDLAPSLPPTPNISTSSSSLRDRVFTPPPPAASARSSAVPVESPRLLSSPFAPLDSLSRTADHPLYAFSEKKQASLSSSPSSSKDIPPSRKVPFGFRHSKSLGLPVRASLLLNGNRRLSRLATSNPVTPTDPAEQPSSPSPSPPPSSESPPAGSLRPLRLSTLISRTNSRLSISASNLSSSNVNSYRQSGNIHESASSAPVSSHNSPFAHRSLSSAPSSAPHHYQSSSTVLQSRRSPSLLTDDLNHLATFGSPISAPVSAPPPSFWPSGPVRNRFSQFSQVRPSSRLSEPIYEQDGESENENDTTRRHDLRDEVIRRPIAAPPRTAPATRSGSVPRAPMYALATPKPTLLFAIASDDVEQVRQALENGDSGPNDCVGPQSALAFALTNDQLTHKLEIVKTLLAFGADPSALKEQPGTGREHGPEAQEGPSSETEPHQTLIEGMDAATRYYMKRADSAHTKQISKLIHRSFFRPLTRVRYDVIGQDRALEELFKLLSIHSRRISVAPVVVMFSGPSGHGKSLLARRFGSLLDVPTHTVNMVTVASQKDLWESYSIGLQAQEETANCTLAEFLVNNEGKRCVVVLDEIEKVENEKVLWSLLMPWEHGRCSFEAKGRPVDVRNVVWLCTSNVGKDLVFEYWNARADPDEMLSREEFLELVALLRPRVSERLGASVLSRITAVLPFVPFTLDEKKAICAEAVYQLGGEDALSLSSQAIESLIDDALGHYIPEEGVRSLHRAVSNGLADVI